MRQGPVSTRVQSLTSLQPWHPSSWYPSSELMQPLRLVFSFDHLTSVLFGPSISLNAPSLAEPRRRRFSAPDRTQTLLPLPLLPFQNPPALLPVSLLLFQNPPATEGSQSSGPEDKNWFHSKAWLWVLGALAVGMTTLGIVRAGSFLCHLEHADYQRVLSQMPLNRSGKICTNHFGDV
jgi:hypothetical protein